MGSASLQPHPCLRPISMQVSDLFAHSSRNPSALKIGLLSILSQSQRGWLTLHIPEQTSETLLWHLSSPNLCCPWTRGKGPRQGPDVPLSNPPMTLLASHPLLSSWPNSTSKSVHPNQQAPRAPINWLILLRSSLTLWGSQTHIHCKLSIKVPN